MKKPNVLLFGNSHLYGINADKLSRNLSALTKNAYMIKDADNFIQDFKTKPDKVVLQVTTNEANT